MFNLGIVSQGGDFLPYIKYNGKAGRWYVKKDEGEVEVQNPVFVADFDNIKSGWFRFMEGQAPNVVLDDVVGQAAAKPSDLHKRGFRLECFSNALFGGVVELQGASMHLNSAIQDLYAEYAAAKDANAGKLPVVKCTGTTPMKDKMGTNYRPVFAIEKWVDRPAELSGEVKANAPTVPKPAPIDASSVSEF